MDPRERPAPGPGPATTEGYVMAVAVKNTPETQTAGLFDRLGAASLAGVVYVVASLAIAFTGIPTLIGRLGLTGGGFMPIAAQVLAVVVALVVLAVIGIRMMGSPPRPGLKAGIFMGVVFLLLTLLVGRWVGGIVESLVYNNGWFKGNEALYGGIIGGVLTLLFAYWLFRRFFRPSFEQWLNRFEDQGWFSAAPYKKGQGMRVRRGTILGLLLLAGSGIWVMVNQGILARGPADWTINLPFTGKLVVDDLGDAGAQLKDLPQARLSVQSSGESGLAVGDAVDRDRVAEVVAPLAEKKVSTLQDLVKKLAAREEVLRREAEGTNDVKRKQALEEERDRLKGWREQLTAFEPRLQQEGDARLLVQRDIDRFVKNEQEREKDRKKLDQDAARVGSLNEEMGWIVRWAESNRLPVVAPVVDRFEAHRINQTLDPETTRIVKNPEAFEGLAIAERRPEDFKAGSRISSDDLETARGEARRLAVVAGKDEEDQRRAEQALTDAAPPARPMKGTDTYGGITLLPAVRYTVPLLLLFLAVWIAWRIVNLPTFGDFLIATEGEVNKVSWTTRSRLYQDTLVVLWTVVLMALFLFVVDIAWAKILSSRFIGVLQVQEKKAEDGDKANLKW